MSISPIHAEQLARDDAKPSFAKIQHDFRTVTSDALNDCLRRHHGMVRKAFADDLELTVMGLSKLMDGDSLPSFPVARRIYKWLFKRSELRWIGAMIDFDIEAEIERRVDARMSEEIAELVAQIEARKLRIIQGGR